MFKLKKGDIVAYEAHEHCLNVWLREGFELVDDTDSDESEEKPKRTRRTE